MIENPLTVGRGHSLVGSNPKITLMIKSIYNRKKYSFLLATVLFLSCSQKIALRKAQSHNLKQVENTVFALIPEKQLLQDSLPAERLKIELSDRTLFANWVSAGEEAKAFFILHGNGETVSDWRPLQAYLFSKGYSSFVFDYTGFGSSTGKPTVNNLNQDAIEAYKRFANLTNNAKERIAFAHSLGCSILLETANKYSPKPVKIVNHAGFSTLIEIRMARKMITDSSKKYFPDVWNGYKNIKKIKVPLYIIHSAADKTIPISMGEALAKSGGEKVRFLRLEKTGHNAVYLDPTDKMWLQIFSFITNNN